MYLETITKDLPMNSLVYELEHSLGKGKEEMGVRSAKSNNQMNKLKSPHCVLKGNSMAKSQSQETSKATDPEKEEPQ